MAKMKMMAAKPKVKYAGNTKGPKPSVMKSPNMKARGGVKPPKT